MYERNAIVIDRYFAEMFGYNEKDNLKDNYKNYGKLVFSLKEYQNISKEEDIIMVEYEKSANEIRDTQKVQESLYKRCLKLQETRHNLFDNLDESVEILQKKFSKIEEEIEKNNLNIKSNSENFVEKIGEFARKSEERVKCGRERRISENEYQKNLTETKNCYEGINSEKIEIAKQFLKQENIDDIKEEIKNQILKNGGKEKISFDVNVIVNAIDVCADIEKKKLEILISVYEKTGRILNEIKNETVKIEKHQKYLKDVNSKSKFLDIVSEYIVLFLDNERMSVVGGEKEHKKLMDEACQNFQKDLEQIYDLYDLLLKEITAKSTKKMYKEKYNIEYLLDLLEDEKNFEKSISRLNVVGTIIYPSYWRVEGMQKIYDVFKDIISNTYEKDLSEYEPLEISYEEENIELVEDEEDDDFDWGDDIDEDVKSEEDSDEDEEDEDEEETEGYDENVTEEDDDFDDEWEDDEDIDDDDDEETEEIEEDDEDEDDRIIDEILGFYNNTEDEDIDLEKEMLDEDDTDEEEDDIDDIDFDWDDEEEAETLDNINNSEDDEDEKEDKKSKKVRRKNKKRK